MCNPAAFALVSIVVAVGSTAATVSAQQKAADAAQEQAKYRARTKEIAAADEIDRAKVAIAQHDRRSAAVLSEQLIHLGTYTQVAEGTSALGVLETTAAYNELDRLTIENNARRRATLLLAGADLDIYAGEVAQANADQASIASGISLAGSIVSAGAQAGAFGDLQGAGVGSFGIPAGSRFGASNEDVF